MTRLQAFKQGAMNVITFAGAIALIVGLNVIVATGKDADAGLLQKIAYVMLSDPNPYR